MHELLKAHPPRSPSLENTVCSLWCADVGDRRCSTVWIGFTFISPRKSKEASALASEGRIHSEPSLRPDLLHSYFGIVSRPPQVGRSGGAGLFVFRASRLDYLAVLLNPHKLLSQDSVYPRILGPVSIQRAPASCWQQSAALACSCPEFGFPWESTCHSAGNSLIASE